MTPKTTLMTLIAVLATTTLAVRASDDETPQSAFFETATVHAKPLSTATASVTVIDRQTIEESGALTVAELMRYSPGLAVLTIGSRAGLTAAQVRGGDPNFTLVLIDGVPLNDSTDQFGGAVNLDSLSTVNIEKVEIYRGPTSHFYGSAALGGVINVITRRGNQDNHQVGALVEGGDNSLRRASADTTWSAGEHGFSLSAVYQEEQGRVGNDRFEETSLRGNADLDLGARTDLALDLRIAAWEGDDYAEGSGGPVLGDGQLRTSEHEEFSLGGTFDFGSTERPRHKLRASIYRHNLDRISPEVVGPTNFLPETIEQTEYTRGRLGWVSTAIDREQLEVHAGAELDIEDGTNESLLLLPDFLGGPTDGSYELDRLTPAIYADVTSHHGNVTLEASARIDFPEDLDAEPSPRFGVSYRPGDRGTRLHGSVSRAFKLPSFFALGSPVGGNPDLAPETSVGADLGVEHRFGGGKVDLGFTLFYNEFENLITFDFMTFSLVNRDEVRSEGAELSFGWRPIQKFSLEANATWNDVEDTETGEPLLQRPEWVGNVRLRWHPIGSIDLWLEGEFVDGYRDQQIPVDVDVRDSVASHTIVGLAGSWRFTKRFELFGRVDNLGDASYETLIGFPGPERAARLGLRFVTR